MDRQTGSPGRSFRCFDGNCGVIVKDSMYNGCGDGDINLEDNDYLEDDIDLGHVDEDDVYQEDGLKDGDGDEDPPSSDCSTEPRPESCLSSK